MMRISDVITELTFQGRRCTKDCSGHRAGYNYAIQNKLPAPSQTPSPSFDDGTDLGVGQLQTGKIIRPKVRDERGRFHNPSSKPKQPQPSNQSMPIRPIGTG